MLTLLTRQQVRDATEFCSASERPSVRGTGQLDARRTGMGIRVAGCLADAAVAVARVQEGPQGWLMDQRAVIEELMNASTHLARVGNNLNTAPTPPMRTMRAHGRRQPAHVRTRRTGTVEAALPGRIGSLRREGGWDALVATLDQAECAGHDTYALLHKAVAWRELDTADRVTDVLVWRLRRLGRLPADPSQPRAGTRTTKQQPQPARTPATPMPQNSAAPEHRRRR